MTIRSRESLTESNTHVRDGMGPQAQRGKKKRPASYSKAVKGADVRLRRAHGQEARNQETLLRVPYIAHLVYSFAAIIVAVFWYRKQSVSLIHS